MDMPSSKSISMWKTNGFLRKMIYKLGCSFPNVWRFNGWQSGLNVVCMHHLNWANWNVVLYQTLDITVGPIFHRWNKSCKRIFVRNIRPALADFTPSWIDSGRLQAHSQPNPKPMSEWCTVWCMNTPSVSPAISYAISYSTQRFITQAPFLF